MTWGFTRSLALVAIAMVCAVGTFSAPASAQVGAWPNKPIRYIVPFPPGGSTDTLARLLQTDLSKALGVPIVIEHKPGAGGGVGSDHVAKSPADGYTILGGTISTHAINASLYKNLPYDPVKDFVPLTQLVSMPNVLVVPEKFPVKDAREFLALAKTKKQPLACASAGNGTSQHLTCELFNITAGSEITHVPFKGGGPGMTAVIAGDVQAMFDNAITAIPHVKGGRVRALAVSTGKRSSLLPDLPTLAEAGLPGFEVNAWQGVFMAAGTPKDITDRVAKEIRSILAKPEIRDRILSAGTEPVGSSPEEFGAFVKNEVAKWADVVKKSGAKVD
jgi:tripartite-type tricarboxylate transporter receptor subunit TctC